MLDTTPLHVGAITATDYRCRFGPHDRAYPEMHDAHSVSYVRKGSFGYRTRGQQYELVAGSVLIGRPGDEFVCTHEHHRGGDECLSFRFEPEVIESLGAFGSFRTPCLPPLAELMLVGERAQAAANVSCENEAEGLDELGLMLAMRVAQLTAPRAQRKVVGTPSDRRRAVEAAIWLDLHADETIDLQRTAAAVGLSPFHFLRVFKRAVGVTPHQYLVRCRLRRAAKALAERDQPISDVAFECGFADLSNFVRTFGRAAGVSPREFRARAHMRRDRSRVRPREDSR